ncbi:DUF3397 domain-containing protein [Metabacillus endolithicus]|uniref:DUF3397 domain-containing protein n=1 Tax=Metabacillus endolithicus TaxID=1535204 RepID=A0ABW5BVP4_9BACI|nr:DUF3397 domain-containing protein [Metabacillus endolithicus]UPG63173.1 DUF3397 domain-containing protein [Metabacillus endolithicus]
MSGFFTWIVSVAITLPILSLLFIYFLVRIFVSGKKTILWTVDLSTAVFILSVHFHLLTIFEQSFLLYIILLLTFLALVVYYFEYKSSREPSMYVAIKKMWRLSFFLFFITYVVLTIGGILTGVFKSAFLL